MKINLDAIKILELKLAEYDKANGTIAEHASTNTNGCTSCTGMCTFNCMNGCTGTCKYMCADGPTTRKH